MTYVYPPLSEYTLSLDLSEICTTSAPLRDLADQGIVTVGDFVDADQNDTLPMLTAKVLQDIRAAILEHGYPWMNPNNGPQGINPNDTHTKTRLDRAKHSVWARVAGLLGFVQYLVIVNAFLCFGTAFLLAMMAFWGFLFLIFAGLAVKDLIAGKKGWPWLVAGVIAEITAIILGLGIRAMLLKQGIYTV